MRKYSKKTKKLLHELAGEAYEEELQRALVPLSESFDKWKKHDISSGELSDLIHDFNRGPARDLLVKYDGSMEDLMVSSAIARGILGKHEVPEELLEQLSDLVEYCEERLAKK